MSRSANIFLGLLSLLFFGTYFWLGAEREGGFVAIQMRQARDPWLVDVDRIEILDGTQEVVLRRHGGTEWRVSGSGFTAEALADATRVVRLLDSLEFARPGATPGLPSTQLQFVGTRTIRIEAGGGERRFGVDIYVLPEGRGRAVFLREEGGPSGWLRDVKLADLVSCAADEWKDPRLMPVDPLRAVRMALEGPDGRAELAIQGREWRYIQPVHARARQDVVRSYLARLAGMKASSGGVARRRDAPVLSGGRQLFGVLVWTDILAGTHELHIWETSGGEIWGEYDNGRRQVFFGEGVPAGLMVDPMSFVPQQLVLFQSSGVLGIQYRAPDGGWTVQRVSAADPWRVESPYQAPAEVEIVRDFLDVMGRLSVTRIIGSWSKPQLEDVGPRPGRISVRLLFTDRRAWDVIGDSPSVPALDIELERLQPDGLVGARLDEGVLYSLDASLSDALGWSPEDLRDRTVHAAEVASFSAIHVRRGEDRLDWQESGKTGEWIDPWIRFLSEVRAVRYVSRDPQRVGEFGLNRAEVEIDWNLRAEDSLIAHRLVFSGGGVGPMYGMLDESGWVFELDPDEAQSLLFLLQEMPRQGEEEAAFLVIPEGAVEPAPGGGGEPSFMVPVPVEEDGFRKPATL